MDILFEKNTLTIAEGNTAVTLTTTPHPMGGMNYGALTLNIHSIIDHSSGTPSLAVTAQGSNDGVEFASVGTLDLSAQTTTGLFTAAGDFPFTLDGTTAAKLRRAVKYYGDRDRDIEDGLIKYLKKNTG